MWFPGLIVQVSQFNILSTLSHDKALSLMVQSNPVGDDFHPDSMSVYSEETFHAQKPPCEKNSFYIRFSTVEIQICMHKHSPPTSLLITRHNKDRASG